VEASPPQARYHPLPWRELRFVLVEIKRGVEWGLAREQLLHTRAMKVCLDSCFVRMKSQSSKSTIFQIGDVE
jgi:hypothetical protein